MYKILLFLSIIIISVIIYFSVVLTNQYEDCNIVTAKFGHNNRFKKNILAALKTLNKEKGKKIDSYYQFPDYILNDKKWEKHLKFLKDPKDVSQRGGGYWFWKAPIMKHHLERMKDGEYYVHLDLDKVEQVFLRLVVPYMLHNIRNLNKDIGLIILSEKELVWTKRDILDHFGYTDVKYDKDDNDINTWQYNANIIIIKKSANTIKFVKEWENLLAKWELVNDDKSKKGEYEFLEENRHDQSLLSMLIKKYTKDKYVSYDKYFSYINLKDI